ncbi:MAG: hypothetical protein U5L09_17335 [Bacteroidales bacterium]|nr:hypothetical protein [Bacteroidales bacterium]
MSKNKKQPKPQLINLTEEMINDFMEELKAGGNYEGLTKEELRVKAVELLFEQYDPEE